MKPLSRSWFFAITLLTLLSPLGSRIAPAADAVDWQPGDPAKGLPGLIPAPAEIPELGRWQIMPLPLRGYIEMVAFSPDGKSIAFADGGYVRIHNTFSMKLTGALLGHNGNVRAIDWSPDGKWIATAGEDSTVRIWKSTGEPGPILKGHTAAVRAVAWNADSQSLASAGLDGTIRFWQTDGTPGIVIDGHNAPVHTLDFSPDGKTLAAGDENHLVRLWNVDGTAGPVLKGHLGAITEVEWSRDGAWLATCDTGRVPVLLGQAQEPTIRLWTPDGKSGPVLSGHSRSINAVTWNPDSKKLVTAGEDRQVIVWDTDGNQLEVVDQGRKDRNDVFALDWHPDKPFFAAGGRFSVRYFSPNGPFGPTKLIRLPGTKLECIDWSPQDETLAVASRDGTVRIWSNGLRSETIIVAHNRPTNYVRFHPDGKRLATVSFDESLREWDTAGNLLQTHAVKGFIGRCISWSQDGDLLAACYRFNKGNCAVFRDGKDQESFVIHNGQPLSLDFNPQGTQIVSGGGDGKILLTRLTTDDTQRQTLAELTADDGDVDSVAWSPDGKWIASGHDSSVRLWHPDGQAGPVMSGFEAAVMRLDWSPDSKMLATGSWDTTVQLWNVNGEMIRKLPGHAAPCWGVSFSPDASQLATCGWDGVMRLLDTKTGEIQALAIFVADTEVIENDINERRQAAVSFNRAGQVLSGDPQILDARFVYLVEQPSGAMKILKPSEFFSQAPGADLKTTGNDE
ncbi:WD40 repeat domain-containing protein [Symmachiella dynata]|uniref:WD40 repeat domain-containing protein n=1 Tax=Symmachiella dynata TaxID=2527995 RepID=UPI0030ECB14D